MSEGSEKDFRKIARDFRGRVKLMEKIPLEKLEKMFIEIYEYGVKDYIKKEKEQYPEMTTKEIILKMYDLRNKLKGRKK